jgi:GTP cyclohydrolase IA
MKQKETLLNSMGINFSQSYDEMGDEHIGTSHDTPLREDAFEMDDELKMELIEKHFREIMHVLGLDLTDDSLKGTQKEWPKCTSKRFSVVLIQKTSRM